ncbi:MAG: hypothetical protein ACREGH_02620, partial [Minisyncoccia bacterium]
MWVLSVYLIGPAAEHKEFSYFSARERELGEVVKLPARGSESLGLIVRQEEAALARQEVRRAGFALKKIDRPGKKLFAEESLRAFFEIARSEAVSVGAVMSALAPALVLQNPESMPQVKGVASRAHNRSRAVRYCIKPRGERLEAYGRQCADMLVAGKSAIIMAPSVVEAERIAKIIPRAVLLHGSMGKKALSETWRDIAGSKKPRVIVGTTLALSAPRNDIGAVILERALARGFARTARPFVDARVCAEKLAEAWGAEFTLGSSVLPVVDADKKMSGTFLQSGTLRAVRVVDMRPKEKIDAKALALRPKFEIFSDEVLTRATAALSAGESIVLLCARRGLAPHTMCDDCGTSVSCPRCASGLVLHEEKRPLSLVEAGVRRWFECPYCGFV